MHGHLRVRLGLGPFMGWAGLSWVSDFLCPSLLCLSVLGPSLSFRSVSLHPYLFPSYLSMLSPAFSSYFFLLLPSCFRYFAFSLHFRVLPVYHICLMYFFFVAISFLLFARHFPFFVASQFFPFPFILSLTVFRLFPFDSFFWNRGILACCSRITAAVDVYMS